MILKQHQAAQLLMGKTLPGGWKVIEKIEPKSTGHDGFYSAAYKVLNDGRLGFLKAFDYSGAEKIGSNFEEELANILNAFNFEREILEECRTHSCKNVIEILDSGHIEIEETIKYPRVSYLILEYAAEGDVLDMIEQNRIDLEWKIKSLHQVAKGLSQLHNLSIAHQDIKPSNIVGMGKGYTKLTDLGSAISLRRDVNTIPKHLFEDFSGSWDYAPPELLYGAVPEDAKLRRFGCDLYLLGSMVCTYFTDMGMTALIRSNLHNSLLWTNLENRGQYSAVLSYLTDAFEQALDDIGKFIDNQYIREKVVLCIRYLCHPDPQRRGHVRDIERIGSNYSLERFITMFDLLSRKIKLGRI